MPSTRCLQKAAGGQLGKQLEAKFDLRNGRDPQVYGLGIKELWEIPAAQHVQRHGDAHRWLAADPANTYGGSWMYHYGEKPRFGRLGGGD